MSEWILKSWKFEAFEVMDMVLGQGLDTGNFE